MDRCSAGAGGQRELRPVVLHRQRIVGGPPARVLGPVQQRRALRLDLRRVAPAADHLAQICHRGEHTEDDVLGQPVRTSRLPQHTVGQAAIRAGRAIRGAACTIICSVTWPVATSRLNTAPSTGIEETVGSVPSPVANTVMKRKLVPDLDAVTAVAGTFFFHPVATQPSKGLGLPVTWSRADA